MLVAAGWGTLAALSLLVGTWCGLLRRWPDAWVGVVLGFGAGALVSSVSFELAEEGLRIGGAAPVAVGLGVGAATFFVADRAVGRLGGRDRDSGNGLPLALGALLDGIPEQAVLGIGLAAGGGVSVALLVAIFVSNLPEAIGSASDMRAGGSSTRQVWVLWAAVTALCAVATVGGYLVADVVGDTGRAVIDGFAAGALLVMLVDSMIPEAKAKARDVAGLATVVGFAVAAGLSASS